MHFTICHMCTFLQKNETGGKSKENSEKKENKKKTKNNSKGKDEFENKEYLIKDHFDSVTSSLGLFKDDALCSEPGTRGVLLCSLLVTGGGTWGHLIQVCSTIKNGRK